MKKNKLILAIILFCSLFSLYSCNESSVQLNKQNIPGFTLQNSGNITNLSQLIERYPYDGSQVGIIEFIYRDYNAIGYYKNANGLKTYVDNTGISNYAYAGFRDNRNTPFNVSNLLINGILLRPYANGAYAKEDPNDLDLYFDGNNKNKFYLEGKPNSLIPDTVIGEVVFAPAVKILNIQKGQNVSVSNNLLINWMGGNSNSKITIDFSLTDPSEGELNQTVGFYILTDNTSSHTLSSIELRNGLEKLNAYYDLEVASYEPIEYQMSNGKKIILVGVSKYITTVFVTE